MARSRNPVLAAAGVLGLTSSTTSTASIEVIRLDHTPGRGRLLGWAMVEVTLDGVAVTLQGVTVRRRQDGRAEVGMPSCRAPDGSLVPSVALPDELDDAIARAVLDMYAPGAVPVQVERET